MINRSITHYALLALWFLPLPAFAHDFAITRVNVTFDQQGSFRGEMIYDLDAIALGIPPGTKPPDHQWLRSKPQTEQLALKDKVANYLSRLVRFRFDDVRVDYEIDFPDFGLPADSDPNEEVAALLGIRAVFTGSIPQGARAFSFSASKALGSTLALVIGDPDDGYLQTLTQGDRSEPYPLGGVIEPQGALAVAADYISLGFTHILPKGLDHILFVLGLYLLSTKFKPLLWQVTAFTVAHSVTLALGMYGVVSLSSSIVEPLIALSIAYVAVENLITTDLKPWRPAVVFGFGMLHGLGFAGVLTQLGLPKQQYVTALVSFNVGVEFGQLAVIAIAFAVTGWFWNRVWYRARIVIPASCGIAFMGAYWAVSRILGG